MAKVIGSDRLVVGNTKTSSATTKPKSNRSELSKVAPVKYWVFTFNNYEESDISDMLKIFNEKCEKFTFQEELGENKTKHLQGSIKLLKASRWSELGLSKKIHWEKTKSFDKAFEYCVKPSFEGARRWIFPEPDEELECLSEDKLYPWQRTVLTMCKEKPNKRDVNWIYDPDGNNGKSEFTRFMTLKYKAIICNGGSAKDIANLIKNIKDSGLMIKNMKIFILDLPRCKDGKVSYDILEQIKNGMITNTKYEGMNIMFNTPHLWIMSNELPDKSKMTQDRWKIWTIKNKCLIGSKLEDKEYPSDTDLIS